MILLIDNYDSFTYNLYHIASTCGKVKVVKNDEITVEQVKKLKPSHLLISPGPKRPCDAGNMMDIIKECQDIPMLGVCLGHQAIGEVFGATLSYATKLMHGEQVNVHLANGNRIFQGLAPIIKGARYNSLGIVKSSIPDTLLVIAQDDSGEVMAIKHRDKEIYGLQFHPESILTENGEKIVTNFLNK